MKPQKKIQRIFMALLSRFGVMDHHRIGPTADLAWPRVVTGFARRSQQTADLMMVGWVLGSPGIAGLAFAYAFWQIGNKISLGLSGGTVSLVAQNYGGGAHNRAELAMKMSVWLALVMALPLMAVFFLFPAKLISLVGAAPETVTHGAAYLQVIAFALIFEYLNKIGSRAFAGIGDTFTPMVLRAGGAALNIVLNMIFILVLGMGAAGAALGTAMATVAVTIGFAWGFLGGQYPVGTRPPVRFQMSGPHWDTALGRQLMTISAPLLARKLATSLFLFPLLAIGAVFGTVAVAALEVARQVRGLMNCLTWGFSMAASTLVGQHLGRGEETEAEGYGWDILKVSGLSYLVLAVVVIVLARPIADTFSTEPGTLGLTTTFVAVGAISAVGLGVDGTAHGSLRGSGDTRWPFYGKLLGYYVCAIPIAYLGTVTGLGITGLYLALLLETFVPAIINVYRFHSNAWKSISREYRPDPAD